MRMPNLAVNICGVQFKNPIIAASGTFGFGREFSNYIDINRIGGITVTGITLQPKVGNPPPRIAETPSGILNSVGLQNPGVDYFLEVELPRLLTYDTGIIVNINGTTIDEYCKIAEKLSKYPIDLIELNISCPNVKEGGLAFGAHPDMVYEVTKAVKKSSTQPLVVKLTPNTSDIKETAKAAAEAGCNGLSLINTLIGMAIDINRRKPILANITGGLSGPAIKPVALRMVWEVKNTVDIPIIGMGGAMKGTDVVEFLLAGATGVGVGTANLVSPTACIDILEELTAYMIKNDIEDIDELIGTLKI
ncbi:MAG TPA: dihydroorotate dehydrogenase [Clostridiales bacterium]|nr:dihydroorotate dehydrogenase [Clostridiales bacterium]